MKRKSRAEYQRERYYAKREQVLEYQRNKYQENKEKRRAEKRAARDADPEGVRAYQREQYAKHIEKRRKAGRDRYQANKEKLAAEARERYHANRERIRERAKLLRQGPERKAKAAEATRRWQAEHPERMDIHHAKRILAEQIKCRPRDIPNEVAEAKVEQLKITRWVREQTKKA